MQRHPLNVLSIILSIGFIITLLSCNSGDVQLQASKRKPYRLWVVLDLSDRILESGQVNRDKSVIYSVASVFRALAKKEKFVYSEDALEFAIAEQTSVPYEDFQRAFVDSMSVDLARMHFSKRRVAIDSFESKSKFMIDELYSKAQYSTDPKMFSGANIPEFFADHLRQQVNLPDDSSEYFVFIVTDGYPYVDGTFSRDVSNLPVFSMPKNRVNVMLLEINPNNQDIYRFNEIKHSWYQWLAKIGVNRMFAIKYSATDDEKKRTIENFIYKQLTDSITGFTPAVSPKIPINVGRKETLGKTVSAQVQGSPRTPTSPPPPPPPPIFANYNSIKDDEKKIEYFLTKILDSDAARSSAEFRNMFSEVSSLISSFCPDHKRPGTIYSLSCTNKQTLLSVGRANLSQKLYQNLVVCLQKCP